MFSLLSRITRKPTKIKTILVSATVFSVGITAVLIYFPWKLISIKNINNLTAQISQETAQHTSLEVGLIFKSAQVAQTFLQKASDRNVVALDRQESVEQIFFSLIESRPNLTWVMFGYPNGDFLGVQRTGEKSFTLHRRKWNASEKQSNHVTLSYEIFGEDLRLVNQETEQDKIPYYSPDRPWYKEAINRPGEVAWTTYVRRTNNKSTLDSAITVNKNNNLIGVLNLGFDLDQVSRSLQQIQNNKKGTIFITNSKSQLIASSDIQDTIPKQAPGQDEPQLNILESANNPLIRGISQELKSKEIKLDGKGSQNFRYRDPQSGEMNYVVFIPLNHLDWVVGIVKPESLYLGEIQRNEIILVIVILGCILLTLALSIKLINRVIIRPILKLNIAARQVAEQTFSEDSIQDLLDRPDEIGELAQVINEMAQQVDGREQGLRRQMSKLEREAAKIQRENSSFNTHSNLNSNANFDSTGDGSNNPYRLIQRARDLRRTLENPDSPLV
jgi:HAMP domain-containing protein